MGIGASCKSWPKKICDSGTNAGGGEIDALTLYQNRSKRDTLKDKLLYDETGDEFTDQYHPGVASTTSMQCTGRHSLNSIHHEYIQSPQAHVNAHGPTFSDSEGDGVTVCESDWDSESFSDPDIDIVGVGHNVTHFVSFDEELDTVRGNVQF